MRRLASLLLALLLLALPVLGMTACDETSGGTVTLYVYNWGEYISDGSEVHLIGIVIFSAIDQT